MTGYQNSEQYQEHGTARRSSIDTDSLISQARMPSTPSSKLARLLAIGSASVALTALNANANSGDLMSSDRQGTSIRASIDLEKLSPRQQSAHHLKREVRLKVEDARVDDLLSFVSDICGVQIEGIFQDDRLTLALDPDTELSVRQYKGSAAQLLDKIAERSSRYGEECGWQILKDGRIQFGLKENLIAAKELHIYDLNDLLFEVPDFANAPALDLDAALSQGGQGGGGGGSIFQDNDTGNDPEPRSQRDQLEELRDLIMSLVEPELWEDSHNGPRIQIYRNSLLITAPEFMHRQIGGLRT